MQVPEHPDKQNNHLLVEQDQDMSIQDAVSSPINIVATPLVEMPLFLGVMLLVSLCGLIFAVATRPNRAYALGPVMGQTLAIIVSWLPIAALASATSYFIIQLARQV